MKSFIFLFFLSCLSFSYAVYTFSGVATNIQKSLLINSGWTVCYSETYGQSGKSLDQIKRACNGTLTMLACQPNGASYYTVAAYANSSDVWYPTGRGDTPHNSNGVSWYFDSSYSMGYVPQGAAITRNSCDTGSTQAERRLCFHTGSGVLNGGWRCGSTTGLNSNNAWTRVYLTSNLGTCETDADCYHGYGVCVNSYWGKHCSCLSGFSGSNCTERPSEVCDFSPVQSNTTRFDPRVNFGISNSIVTMDVFSNLENNKFIEPSLNDTTTSPPYSLDTMVTYGTTPTACDYPNGDKGIIWNKTVDIEFDCEDRWRSTYTWSQARYDCGFSDPDGDNIWTQTVTVARRYQLPSLPDGTPITRTEKITKKLNVVFPTSVRVTTGVAIYGPEAVTVSSVVEVSYSPATDLWSIVFRTYTEKPYKLSSPSIRYISGNLVNRYASSSVVETPACNDQSLPCSQLITLYFRGCARLEGALTVDTDPICSVAQGPTCPPVNQIVTLNMTVSSSDSCGISNSIDFSETRLESFSSSDCTVPRTLFAASDLAYFGGVIRSEDVDVDMVYTVSSVCFVYNNGPCISIAFNQLSSANGRDPVFELNLAQSRFFTNSTEMQSFIVQATINVSWQNSKRTAVIKAESNFARVNLASSIGISDIHHEEPNTQKEQQTSSSSSLFFSFIVTFILSLLTSMF